MASATSVAFDRKWDRSRYSCGVPELDAWLKEQAGQAEDRHNSRTFLFVDDADGRVVGYYTLLTYRLELDEVSSALGAGRYRYPMPAILLARLAIDVHAQGQGLGSILLLEALGRMAEAGKSVGFEVVIVDAVNESAGTFYRKFGFVPFADRPLRLFLLTKDLLATLDASI